MRFHAEHRFPAPPDAVVDVLLDPGFYADLDLPDLSPPEVVDHDADGLRLRYEFVGSLDPVAKRLLGGQRLVWLQELRVDRAASTGRLSFAVEASPDRLRGAADFVFSEEEDGGTLRRLDGEIKVSVPVVGGTAERRIVPGVLRRLDIEAAALAERLAGG